MGSRKMLRVVMVVAAVTLAFVGGYLVGCRLQQRSSYLNSMGSLQHSGNATMRKLPAGTYRIPIGQGHKPVMLVITSDSRSDGVRKILLADTGVFFEYRVWGRRYGVPSATLITGRKNLASWVDLGLKGRFSIECRPRLGPPLYLLHGNWVSLDKLRFIGKSTRCRYRGHIYFFDKSSGEWEPVPTGKLSHP